MGGSVAGRRFSRGQMLVIFKLPFCEVDEGSGGCFARLGNLKKDERLRHEELNI